MSEQLIGFAQALGYAAIAFVCMFIAKIVADLRVRRIYDPRVAIEESSNLAVGLRRGGMYLGLAVGMLGALQGGGGGFVEDATLLAIEGIVLVGLMLLAREITDAVVVHGIKNDEACRDGNVAVGIVEAGVYIASGLVAQGAFAGPGGGLLSALVFFGVAQVALIVLAVAYEYITSYEVIAGIRDGNVAAGAMLAAMLVAFGFILRASVAGPFTAWVPDLIGFAVSAVCGIALLLALQWPIDRLFLPGTTLKQEIEGDRNVAAIAVAGSVKVALALVIGVVVI